MIKMIKNNLPVIIILLAFLNIPVFSGLQKTIEDVERCIGKKEYIEAKRLLFEGMYKYKNEPENLVKIYDIYTDFLLEYVGDYEKAKRYYEKIINADVPESNSIRLKAVEKLQHIKQLESKFKKENEYLDKLYKHPVTDHKDEKNVKQEIDAIKKFFQRNPESYDITDIYYKLGNKYCTIKLKKYPYEKVKQRKNAKIDIKKIKKFIKENPDYYRIALMYYLLGKKYFAIRNYKKACANFNRALNYKPALGFLAPIGNLKEKSRKILIENRKRSTALYTGIILLLITIAFFYYSKPWKWVSWKHLIILLSMILLWIIIFSISTHIVGKKIKASETVIQSLSLIEPTYISSEKNAPGNDFGKPLFSYGLILIFGVYLFSLCVNRSRFYKYSIFLNLSYSILLSITVILLFDLNNCKGKADFYPGGKGMFGWFTGNYFYNVEDIDPYILINPQAYPQIKIENINDPVMRKWVKEHIEIIQEKSDE